MRCFDTERIGEHKYCALTHIIAMPDASYSLHLLMFEKAAAAFCVYSRMVCKGVVSP